MTSQCSILEIVNVGLSSVRNLCGTTALKFRAILASTRVDKLYWVVAGWQFLFFVFSMNASALGADNISGVITSDSGLLVDIKVVIYADPAIPNEPPHITRTDEEGRFSFNGLNGAWYRFEVNAPGYFHPNPTQSDRRYQPGSDVTITMVKGGVITGRVLDQDGEPVIRMRMRVRMMRNAAGQAAVEGAVRHGEKISFVTDDRGVYRIFGLPPGRYVIGTEPQESGSFRYSPYDGDASIYYPGTTFDKAEELNVLAGTEISGIDFRYRSVSGLRLSGKLLGAVGKDPRGWRAITLRYPDAEYDLTYCNPKIEGALMTYEFGNLSPGEYELKVARPSQDGDAGASSGWQRVKLTSKDVTNFDLTMNLLAQLSGSATLEPMTPEEQKACGPLPQVNLNGLWLSTEAIAETGAKPRNKMTYGQVQNPPGTWSLGELEAGRHRISLYYSPVNVYLRELRASAPKASLANIVNLFNMKPGEKRSEIRLTLAATAAGIHGKVDGVASSGDVLVHLIPVEAADADNLLRYAQSDTSPEGFFGLYHLAPGKYWLLALAANGSTSGLPLAYDAAQRLNLRQTAMRVGKEITLTSCQITPGIQLTVSKP